MQSRSFMAVTGFAAVLKTDLCPKRSMGYQMNARMKKAVRPYGGPFVISAGKTREDLRQGGWIRFQRTLERIRLLLSSPIASFRWARAKRKLTAGKKGTGTPKRRGWCSTFADYERDGIVMGF